VCGQYFGEGIEYRQFFRPLGGLLLKFFPIGNILNDRQFQVVSLSISL
jgi:hypothetical protein